MAKSRVAVLRGGPSEEYEVSMRTGASVLNALADTEYEPIDVTITRSGEWLVNGYTRKSQDILSSVDVVFIGLHGSYGEDGTVQRLLESVGVPYTGSKAYSSALAMNKILAKEHLYDTPIKMAPHMRVTGDRNTDITRIAFTLEDLLGPECVVKPVSGGSSIGTKVVRGGAELAAALREAFNTRTEMLVEKRIQGREATCGVIDRFRGEQQYVLPAIEIVCDSDQPFFTHDAKYGGKAAEICPGRFSASEKEMLSEYAKLVHTTLGLAQYSRSDFILADDGVYFLEVNTLPGLTPQSLMPKALEAVGSSHREFIRHLLKDALMGTRKRMQ